jgi:hypothetical protein
MSKRNDIHSPKNIIVTDYEFVALEYIKIGGTTGDIMVDCDILSYNRELIRQHMAKTGGTYSNHEHKGNCQICSANCVYTALFYHEKTNVYIRTGMDCAEKLDMACNAEDMLAFRTALKMAHDLAKGKRKALDTLERKDLQSAWKIYTSVYGTKAEVTTTWNELKNEERIIVDIVGKLVKYGEVSDKSLNYVDGLLGKIFNRATIEAERKLAYDKAQSITAPSGRTQITGKVLSIKMKETAFGMIHKMLVENISEGWKVYGSVPSKVDITVGNTIEFDAVVTVSDNDTKFGFFSRPPSAV